VKACHLVHRIRTTIAPNALADGMRAFVGGQTAFIIDAADAVAARLPWVIVGSSSPQDCCCSRCSERR